MLYVSCLYLLMTSPHHDTREAATREFVHRVQGWPHLYGQFAADKLRTTASPERSHRLQRPVKSYRSWQAASYTPSTVPAWPCCDMLPGTAVGTRDRDAGVIWKNRAIGGDVAVNERYKLDYHEFQGEEAAPYWRQWRKGTEFMARQLIADGAKPETVDALLSRMWAIELECESDMPGCRDELESWKGWNGGYPQP